MKTTRGRWWRSIGLGAALLLIPATALGQMGRSTGEETPVDVPQITPARVDDPGRPGVLLSYGVAAVLVIAVVGIAVMPAKRTHQD